MREPDRQAALQGGLSVSVYGLLKNTLGLELHQVVVAAVIETMVLWFLVLIVGRGIGQALQLRAIEQRLGCRFVSDRYTRLDAERQRTVVGRLLRKRFKQASVAERL